MPSRVWNHFTRSTDKKTATCNLCSQEFVYKGTTSNLLNHLNGQHPAAESREPVKQTTLSLFVNSPKKGKTDAEQTTQAIADMIVSDFLPLSFVEGGGFRALMKIVAPDYTVPCRKTIRSRIERKHKVEKEKLIQTLKTVDSASITTDTWTSNSTESYLTVTEHHIDNDWQMKSNVLLTRAMPERHTGENIAHRLKTATKEFQLENKVNTCVHDNARNMDCAGNLCDNWGDLGCFGHTLQLCLKPALELPAVAKLTNRCRKLVGHFKHSTTLTATLEQRQKTMDLPQHTLVQDVATRWNSTHDMMTRLLEQRRALTDILLDSSLTKTADSTLNLKEHEWDLVQDLCAVLKPFSDTTTYMSTERTVSASEIYPIVCGLINKRLEPSTTDSPTTLRVKESIREQLTDRFNPTSDSAAQSTPALASLLDVRYKKLPFFTTQQRKATIAELESRLDDLPLRLPSTEQDETPAKRRRLDFLDYGANDRSTEDELLSFLSEKMTDTDPLLWWKENEKRFPKVSVIARQVLSVPATSVPSERIFSAAGLILNKLRNRLSSEIVDSIIFLNKND